ncbi:MAG TPA: hypothetical protein VF518_11585 [Polyangia bacterium]
MQRLPKAWFSFVAALGLSGCLFTDPINKAPAVTMATSTPPEQWFRGSTVEFRATATDDSDAPSGILLKWVDFNSNDSGCAWITAATWTSGKAVSGCSGTGSEVPCDYVLSSSEAKCLCVQAADHQGATAQACQRIKPLTPTPIAVITNDSGQPLGSAFPLYSNIRLSAENSIFAPGDPVSFSWDLQYTGTDSTGKSVKLAPCTGISADKADQHRCFTATVPGPYQVNLTVNDTATNPPKGTAQLAIRINEDTPACIALTDPDVHAKVILLARNTGLGGSYESRTFKVYSVADDGQPYPYPGDPINGPQFVWWVYDPTQANPGWVSASGSTSSFTVSQALFPNVRSGDSIKVRLEVRDSPTQTYYQNRGPWICDANQELCCGQNPCGGTSTDCIRWTTWTVQFQP